MKILYNIFAIASILTFLDANDVCRYSEVSMVLDVSGSISPSEWSKAKDFAAKLVTQIGISADGNRVSVTAFSDFAKKKIYCGDHTNEKSLNNAILTLEQFGEYTNIEDGLRKGKEMLYEKGCGMRSVPPSSRVIILMTDAEANRGGPGGYQDLLRISKEIRDDGIFIYAVGVGGLNMKQLREITGNAGTAFHAKDFNSLLNGDLIKQLTAAVCTKPPTTITTTTPTTTTTTTPATTTTEPTTTITTTTTTTTTPEPTTTTQEPTTTTTTTTTTPEPTTTTTTTPEPEPTTTMITTPEPEPETTTTTPQDLCSCHIDKELYPCIKWTKYEIIRTFTGDCYVDKLKAAIEFIRTRLRELTIKIKAFYTCKFDLQSMIRVQSYNDYHLLFERYDECTINVVCKLHKWKMQLTDKFSTLEKELIIEEEGLGEFSTTNSLTDLLKRLIDPYNH